MVVAGGGSGGSQPGQGGTGGGGAGGYRASGYGPSPLQGSAQELSLGSYTVTVGAGGGAAGVHRAGDPDGFASAGRANPCLRQGHYAHGRGVHGAGDVGGYYPIHSGGITTKYPHEALA